MKRAFTLIELLIVVAIIAILASIAVPNFLEAQIRAKVSRTRADMRSLTVGIECYMVDNNKPPPDFGWDEMRTWKLLTTPVAYLTGGSGLVSVFDIAPGRWGYEFWMDLYSWNGRMLYLISTEPSNREHMVNVYWIASPGADRDLDIAEQDSQGGVAWMLPGQQHDSGGQGTVNIIYDPTNGTVSSGDILRSNVRDLQN